MTKKLALAAATCSLCFFPTSFSQALSKQEALNLEATVNEFGIDGSGVVIAIIDEGIDYRLPDFKNEDGSSRIKYIYDLVDNAGATDSDNPVGRGTVYTQQEINDALENETLLPVVDSYGSSTAIAGILAGNAESPYSGLAPNASLIVVRAVDLGMPGNDSLKFYDPTALDAAVEFVIRKSWDLDLPTVVYVNSRTLGGPSDGSSRAARLIDTYTGSNIPGLIFVTPSSPAINSELSASGSIQPGTTKTITIDKRQESSVIADFWYSASDSNGITLPALSVSITTPNSTTYGPLTPPGNENFISDSNPSPNISIFHRSQEYDFSQSDGELRQLLIVLRGPAGQYEVDLQLSNTANEAADFRANLNSSNRTGSNPSRFLDNIAPRSTSDVASAANAIVVNGYALGSTWTDAQGNPQNDAPANGAAGDLLTGIAETFTATGESVVDFAIPAGSFVAPYSSNRFQASIATNVIEDEAPYYGMVQDNQVAGAIAAGIVAQMLQLAPSLDAEEAKAILSLTTASDSSTGTTPNNRWGSGKLDGADVLELVSHVQQSLALPEFAASSGTKTIHFPTREGFTYTLQHRDSLETGTWEDTEMSLPGDGESQSFTLPSDASQPIPLGFYRVSVSKE